MNFAKYFQEITGFKFIESSTVWNYHAVKLDGVAARKGTNLNNTLKSVFSNDSSLKVVSVVTSAIGRSAHSKTVLDVFAGDWSDCDNHYHSNRVVVIKREDIL